MPRTGYGSRGAGALDSNRIGIGRPDRLLPFGVRQYLRTRTVPVSGRPDPCRRGRFPSGGGRRGASRDGEGLYPPERNRYGRSLSLHGRGRNQVSAGRTGSGRTVLRVRIRIRLLKTPGRYSSAGTAGSAAAAGSGGGAMDCRSISAWRAVWMYVRILTRAFWSSGGAKSRT